MGLLLFILATGLFCYLYKKIELRKWKVKRNLSVLRYSLQEIENMEKDVESIQNKLEEISISMKQYSIDIAVIKTDISYIKENIEQTTQKVQEHDKILSKLEVKAGFWGMLAGALAYLIANLVR